MTVNELIDILTTIRNTGEGNGDMQIVLASDPEGNDFHTTDNPCHSYGRIVEQSLEHVDTPAHDLSAVILWPGDRLD